MVHLLMNSMKSITVVGFFGANGIRWPWPQYTKSNQGILFIQQYFEIACNIDHNSSLNTAQDSFHGTAISRTQHVTNENSGTETSQN